MEEALASSSTRLLLEGELPMRCFPSLAGALLLVSPSPSLEAQAPNDTLPAHVVERMFEAFDRGDQVARSRLYDSVYYFQNLAVPARGDPHRPKALSPAERARQWQGDNARDRSETVPQRSRKVLQRMVVGRFVVYHIAVGFQPPHEGNSFEKLEIYEVKNGKIVAEYDGQHTAGGSSRDAAGH